ncbi:unnamed protein product [Owenia fusiformis]|uniref:Uncharacterized protein n=1 Tax=Owenia fusiformis TaxID=6347 RepID=A0A8J1XYC0_OWEFU|nr:unnamed protein product [Owenia fusiformis]
MEKKISETLGTMTNIMSSFFEHLDKMRSDLENINGYLFRDTQYSSIQTCWFCKIPGHHKATCKRYKMARHYCSLCATYGHRNKDHCEPTTNTNCIKIPNNMHPDLKTASVQTKKIKETDKPNHSKYSQTQTFDMDKYITAVKNYKKIESELYGQKHGNDIYREKIRTMETDTADLKLQLKSQKKRILSLEEELTAYATNDQKADLNPDHLISQLQESQKLITSLQSRNNEYSTMIRDMNAKLDNQLQRNILVGKCDYATNSTDSNLDLWKLGLHMFGMPRIAPSKCKTKTTEQPFDNTICRS